MRAAVENDTAVGTEHPCEAGRLPARCLVAETAIEGFAESIPPAFGIENPGSQLERRPVAHVAPMAAVELRHPIAQLVLVVPDDRALHAASVRRAVHLLRVPPRVITTSANASHATAGRNHQNQR